MSPVSKLMISGLGAAEAQAFAEPLFAACERFGINTPVRQAAFVAQCAHESGLFRHLEEDLTYSTPERMLAMWPKRFNGLADAAAFIRKPEALANRVYAHRLGNRDEATGDGWRYRGRGLIQLTGRANYLAAGDALGAPLKDQPDLVARPLYAALTAAWFWAAGGCNALADTGSVEAVTRAINGPAMAGLADRKSRYSIARVAFP